MMRLNPNPRLNLFEGQRVQSDINGKPDEVYVVRRLFDLPDASNGFAAYCETKGGDPIADSTTAACWFWPEGVLQAIPEKRWYGSEKFALRGAALDLKDAAERVLAGLDS